MIKSTLSDIESTMVGAWIGTFWHYILRSHLTHFVDFYSNEKYSYQKSKFAYVCVQCSIKLSSTIIFPCHLTRSSNLASQDDMWDFLASIKNQFIRNWCTLVGNMALNNTILKNFFFLVKFTWLTKVDHILLKCPQAWSLSRCTLTRWSLHIPFFSTSSTSADFFVM